MGVPLRFIPEEERPREKLLRLGPEKLSDAELLAILLRTGVKGHSVIDIAHTILHHCESRAPGRGLSKLLEIDREDVKELVPGIGDAKLCQILAALQLGRRAAGVPRLAVDVNNPESVYRHLAPTLSDLRKEQFMVIHVNAKNHVEYVETVSEGTLTASLVHPREVFKTAIKRCAHAIILAHNHPSGDPTPSREDREVTRRLIEVGKVVGIEVLDHLIIGHGRYVSLRAEKRLAEWS